MAAFSLYDVLRHLVEKSAWPSEEDRRAAIESIAEAERMSVLGNVAVNIECLHDVVLADGRCEECGRTIEVGHSQMIGRPPITRQFWR